MVKIIDKAYYWGRSLDLGVKEEKRMTAYHPWIGTATHEGMQPAEQAVARV